MAWLHRIFGELAAAAALPAETDLPLPGSPGEDKNGHEVPHLTGPPATDGPPGHLPRSGEDINGHEVPHLADPPVSDGLLLYLPRSGEDKNGHKVPHLADPPASDGPLWYLYRSGEDITGHKVPHLAETPAPDGHLGRTHGAVWNGYLHVDVDKQRLCVDAIMGRLTAGGVHRIELKGESLRRKNQK